MEFYTQYNPPPSDSGAVKEYPEEGAKQEFRDECDVNVIMRRVLASGEALPEGVGTYGDFSDAVDFLEAQLVVKRAEEQFMSLPSRVRDRFNNDPAALLDFVHGARTPERLAEARELGLLAEVAVAPEPAPVVVAPGGVVVETLKTEAK